MYIMSFKRHNDPGEVVLEITISISQIRKLKLRDVNVNVTKGTQSLSSKLWIQSKAQKSEMFDVTIQNRDFYKALKQSKELLV